MLLMRKRRHLFEIHEQRWCPPTIRNGSTDYLRFIAGVARQYYHVVPLLRRALVASRSERIVDLCSGGGGPWKQLQRPLNSTLPAPIPILLTDLYPSHTAGDAPIYAGPNLEFLSEPVDATQVPKDLTGFRTLFTAFHHFRPQDARNILQDAVDSGQGIGIFEQTARTPLALIEMLVLPWIALLSAPFVRPFRVDRLFWTWVIPLIPFVLCFDGIVSCLRTYSTAELHEMIAGIRLPSGGDQYRWEVGRVSSPLSPVGVTYAILYPVRS